MAEPAADSGAEASDDEIQEENNNMITPTNQESLLRNNIRSYSAYVKLKKRVVCAWPVGKKLMRLAPFSDCNVSECPCPGWKLILPLRVATPENPFNCATEPCGFCTHPLYMHISHLEGLPVERLNGLVELCVDSEYLYASMREENDNDTKHVWFYLCRVVGRCIRTLEELRIDGPFGIPPFERINLNKALSLFIMYKYGTEKKKELQKIFYLGALFLNFFNLLNLETPTVRKQRNTDPSDIISYKILFTRWLVYCYIPRFHESLPRHDPSTIFGRQMLRTVFEPTKRQLMANCFKAAESGNIPSKIKDLIMVNLTPFMDSLETELFNVDSSVWDDEHKPTPPAFALPDIFKNTIE